MRLTNIGLELQGATFMNVACPEVFYTLQYNSAEQIQVTHDMMWYDMGVTRTYSYIFDLHQFYCSTFLLLLSLMSVSVTPPEILISERTHNKSNLILNVYDNILGGENMLFFADTKCPSL